MRPRVFPAEDKLAAETAAEEVGASMRPRVFPAEDALRITTAAIPQSQTLQ